MTQNQIAFFKATEEQRHNYEVERETKRANEASLSEQHRANVARENEQYRSNVANETIGTNRNLISRYQAETTAKHYAQQDRISAQLANETARHNAEVERLNRINASIAQYNAETQRYNTEVARLQAQASLQQAQSSALQAQASWQNATTNRISSHSQLLTDAANRALIQSKTQLTDKQTVTESLKPKQMKHQTAQGWFNTASNWFGNTIKVLGSHF